MVEEAGYAKPQGKERVSKLQTQAKSQGTECSHLDYF